VKKSFRKFQLRSETLRRLDNEQIVRVQGGGIYGGYCSVPNKPDSCSTTVDTGCDACVETAFCQDTLFCG
jgi:hypothetical protein